MNPSLLRALLSIHSASSSSSSPGCSTGGAAVAAAAARILARAGGGGGAAPSPLLARAPLFAPAAPLSPITPPSAQYYRAISAIAPSPAPQQAAAAIAAAASSSSAPPKPPPSPTTPLPATATAAVRHAASQTTTTTPNNNEHQQTENPWFSRQYDLDVAALARAVRQDDRGALASVAARLDPFLLAQRAPDRGRALLQVLLQAAARAGDAEVARAVVGAMRAIGRSGGEGEDDLTAEAHRAFVQALAQAGRVGEALRWLRDEIPASALTAKHVVALARPAMRSGDLGAARAAVDWGVEQQQMRRPGERSGAASPAPFDPDETLASLRLQLAAAEGGAPAVRREWRRLVDEAKGPGGEQLLGVRANLARLVALNRAAVAASAASAARGNNQRAFADDEDDSSDENNSSRRPSPSRNSFSAAVQPREMVEALDGLLAAYLGVVWGRWSSSRQQAGRDGPSAAGLATISASGPLPRGPWTGRLPMSALRPQRGQSVAAATAAAAFAAAEDDDEGANATAPTPNPLVPNGPTPLERDLLVRGLDTALAFFTSQQNQLQHYHHHHPQAAASAAASSVQRVLDARAAAALPPTARMYSALAQWRAQQPDTTALDLEALAAEAAAFGALGAGGSGASSSLSSAAAAAPADPAAAAAASTTATTPPVGAKKPTNNNQLFHLSLLGLPFFEALGELYAATEGRAADAERAALDRSRAAGISPTARTYTRLLHGLGGPGDVEAADHVYRRMRAAGLKPDAQAMARLFRAARTAAQNVRVKAAARARAAGADRAARAAALADRAARFASVYARLASWQGDMAARGVRHDRVSLHHLAAALERLNALGDCLELAAAQERALLRHAREQQEQQKEQKRRQEDNDANSISSDERFAAHRSALRVSGRRGGGGADAAGRVAALAERVRAGGGGLSPEDYALVAFSQFWVHRDEQRLMETARAMRRNGVRLDSATGHALLHVYAAQGLWREALGVVDELLELVDESGSKGLELEEEDDDLDGKQSGGRRGATAPSSSSSPSPSPSSSFGADGDGVWHVALRELARNSAPDEVVGAFAARMSPGQRARFAAMYGLRQVKGGEGGWTLSKAADEEEDDDDRGGGARKAAASASDLS